MEGIKAHFFSICILSVFLILGKLLRAKVRLFQNLFLPSAIVGGFLALAVGPQGLGRLSDSLPLGLGSAWPIPDWAFASWSTFPGLLISVVFATLFLGMAIPGPKRVWQQGGSQLCFGVVMGMGQYFVALLVTLLILGPLFGTPPIFATIVEIGFSGGHGTAAGMAQVFDDLGMPAGGALGQMSATVGILVAVVVGITLVNLAIRRGYAVVLSEKQGIPEYKKSGLIPEGERYPIATATVATEAIEPMTFHLGIVGLAILIGWGMLDFVQQLHENLRSFPLFPLAMIGGLLIQILARPLRVDTYFDRATFDRILGLSLDFLVLSAIATLRVDLFLQNFWPFLIIMITAVAWVVFAMLYLAPRMFPAFWFERGITEFGMQTGVTAMGLLLLKLVDPEYKTGTANAFGFKQMVYEPFMGGGLVTALSPLLIVQLGAWQSVAIALGIMIVFFGLAMLNGWVQWKPTLTAQPLADTASSEASPASEVTAGGPSAAQPR